jgi:hypothetical protein
MTMTESWGVNVVRRIDHSAGAVRVPATNATVPKGESS